MSEPEALDINQDASSAHTFSEIMEFLAPEADESPAGAGAEADGGAGPGAAGQSAAAEGAGAAAPGTGAPGSGAAAGAGTGAAGAAPGADAGTGAGNPAGGQLGGAAAEAGAGVGALDATTLSAEFGQISVSFEEAQVGLLRNDALEAARAEFPKYFDALGQHPRSLVGVEVPSLRGDGSMERLKDSADAKEWQEAIRGMLVDDIDARIQVQRDNLLPLFETVHESIQMFQNNPDLVPRTKQFDTELANNFAAAVQPYEVRQNGKLIGYSVPVQPIINALRSQLVTSRGATPTPQQQRAAVQPRQQATGRWDGPQAGISSSAGSSGGAESDDAAGVLGAFLRQNGMSI